MERLFEPLLTQLPFFATGLGVIALGAVAVGMLLMWGWRSALFGLVLIQIGVASLMVQVHRLSLQWGGVQILTTLLCVSLLGLSARQMRSRQAARPPGSWLLRLLVVVMLLASWRVFDIHLAIPLLNPSVERLFLWLSLCALTFLALSDSPFFVAISLLSWSIVMQAVVELLAPGTGLYAIIGMAQIVVALACSYLLLIDLAPAPKPKPIPTDMTFTELPSARLLPAPERRLLPERSGAAPTQQPPPRPANAAPDASAVAEGAQ